MGTGTTTADGAWLAASGEEEDMKLVLEDITLLALAVVEVVRGASKEKGP